MKVNLKKIGAIVAGATILASTAAFAGLYFGDTMLVDDNGAPTFKFVVGEDGASSDGVAAAIGAGNVVGESYKTEELTASVKGTATCSGEAENGTCSVTNEKAQLEITVPGGTAEGMYTVNNLIGDFINRRLLDRVGNLAGNTDAEYPLGGSDVSDNANPFNDGLPAGSLGPTNSFMYRISGSLFSPFATTAVTDDSAGKTYSEQQDMWIEGSSYYSDSDNDVVTDLRFVAYTMKFKGSSDDFGIPVCTTPTNTNYNYCKEGFVDSNFDYATETHKVRVGFLGEPWIISEMNPPDDTVVPALSETQVYPGGFVKLAKESVSGIINQGESLPVDDLKFHLDDLEAHGAVTSAIISVLDANDNILKKDRVVPATTQEFNIGGVLYRFHVYKVAPGYTFGAKWADVAIFSTELKLEDGQQLDPDFDTNQDWQVNVGWKNKGATAAQDQVDHLRTLIIYGDDISSLSSGGDSKLEENDYVPIVQDPVAWKLTYTGLSIDSSDRDSLRYRLERTSPFTITPSKGPWETTGTNQVGCTILTPYVKVDTSKSGNTFEIPQARGASKGDAAADLSNKEFVVATAMHQVDDGSGVDSFAGFYCNADAAFSCPNNMWYVAALDLNPTGAPDVVTDVCVAIDLLPVLCATGPFGECPAGSGSVFMRLSSTNSDYGYMLYPWDDARVAGPAAGPSVWVDYSTIGDGDTTWDTGGIFEIAHYDAALTNAYSWMGDYYGLGPIGNLNDCYNAGGTVPCFGVDSGGALSRLLVATPTAPDWYFAFSEKAGEDSSNNFADYSLMGLYTGGGTPGDATFNFDSQTVNNDYVTREDYTLYMYAGPVENQGQVSTLEEGGVTERGSVFSSVDDTSVTYYMANDLAKAQLVLASADVAGAEAGTCIRTLAEGETSEPCNGVTVKVLEITEDVGPCTGEAASAACEVDMTGVSAVIMPGDAATATRNVMYPNAYKDLVILDRDAVGVNTVVSVGGDKVNTVTAQLLEGAAVDWTTEKVVVREVVKGSKIVVAGAEAEDTLEAMDQFISELKRA